MSDTAGLFILFGLVFVACQIEKGLDHVALNLLRTPTCVQAPR